MTTESRFIAAIARSEKRTAKIKACIVIDPAHPDRWGRVVIIYPRDGAGRLYAVAWLPGENNSCRHCGSATGYGYDKATAAMGGATFVAPNGVAGALLPQGWDWEAQMRQVGFLVYTAC